MNEIEREHYEKLIGFTVESVAKDTEGFPCLTLKKGDAWIQVAVSQDPEGNGPGFLFIEPYKG